MTDYHAKYFAYELTRRYSSDSLQKLAASLSDAQVDLNPHQVEAALFAFRSPLSKGAILADEVGLGKTIEAGIVISQKWAERKRKILIIVPSSLRKQWNQELQDKFFLPSIILETKSFNQGIRNGNLNPFKHNDIVICSYHFARSKDVYIKQVEWDLIVIDEAHHLRNVYKNTNKIANAIKAAVAHAPKLLLTATPLQNTLMELYGLVSIIDDYTFGDLPSFKSRFARLTNNDNFDDLKERLKPICKRTLRRQVLEYVKYTNRIPITQEFYPSENEQRLYDLVSLYLQRQNLYALPASQRQLMTLILRKLLASSTYAISGTLEALSNKLDAIVENQGIAPLFDETISEDFEILDEMKDEWAEDNEEKEETKVFTPEEIKSIKEESKSLKEFHALAKSIKQNSKGEVLLTALKAGFDEAEKRGGVKKAVIFTESTRTQKYLENILEITEYSGKIVLFNGSNTDPKSQTIYKRWIEEHQGTDRITGSKSADMRAALVEYFRDEAIILIATEAGAEGINLQFCSLVVNYDLPWNPQRIEQRIGRCHRYGQRYDVVVVNFLNKKNAADLRVYQLLSEKFKLFEGVFGASDEVLGSIESGIDFEKRIAQIYQQCRTEEEIQSAFDALQKEMEPQIDETISLTRQRLLENFDEEVHEKLRINLQESRDYLSKYENWLWQVTKYYLEPYADFAEDGYSFMLRENPFNSEPIHPGPYRIGKNIDDVNIYRIGHPLAQRLIDKCKSLSLDSQEVVFDYSNTPKRISIIESLVGKSGWLSVINLSIQSFEPEDSILFCGLTDDGLELDIEQCQRLFSLSAVAAPLLDKEGLGVVEKQIRHIAHKQQSAILQTNAERNGGFFDNEIGKLDKWAEDVKNSIELELKELDREIKAGKTEAKKILNLEEKVKAQRQIKEMEKRRNELRMNLYQAQDEIDLKKENLINEIESRMKQQIETNELFTIKWKLI
ncbi:MAG: DEAD/DEAH box helicase family protein [Nitrospirae bacterium]|nr:DEAD/DEAH box helicase family protein [Nitrospirota bacterium]